MHALSKRTARIPKSAYPYLRTPLITKGSLYQLGKTAGKKIYSTPHYYSTFRSIQKPSVLPLFGSYKFTINPFKSYKNVRISMLKSAIRTNNIHLIKKNLQKGTPANDDFYGGLLSQPLYLALFSNLSATPDQNMEVVKTLVEHGAKINIVDPDHFTYMHLFILHRPKNIFNEQYVIDLINLFKEYKFDFNIQTIKSGNTLLHMAIKLLENPMLIVKPLITLGKNDVDINIQDNKGNTPLHIAIIQYDLATTRFLLENNADSLIKNNEGLTSLDYALQSGSNKLINLLKKYTVIPENMYPTDRKEQD